MNHQMLGLERTFSYHLVQPCFQTVDPQALRFSKVPQMLPLCPSCLCPFQPVTLLWTSIRCCLCNWSSIDFENLQAISLVQPSRVTGEETEPQKVKGICLWLHGQLEAATLSFLIPVIYFPMSPSSLAADISKISAWPAILRRVTCLRSRRKLLWGILSQVLSLSYSTVSEKGEISERYCSASHFASPKWVLILHKAIRLPSW